MKIKEYLKLSRSFNAGITACAPVLGALSMWNVNETSFFWLFILFLIGYFGHTYGFALNDILDVKIDQTSTELKDRPLVCKTITMRNAWIFTLSSAESMPARAWPKLSSEGKSDRIMDFFS